MPSRFENNSIKNEKKAGKKRNKSKKIRVFFWQFLDFVKCDSKTRKFDKSRKQKRKKQSKKKEKTKIKRKKKIESFLQQVWILPNWTAAVEALLHVRGSGRP